MHRNCRISAAIWAFMLMMPVLEGAGRPPLQQPDPKSAKDAIVQRIDEAVTQRFNAISGYTVEEHYALYRNGETSPAAAETIHTVYNRATGKDYTPVEQSGSSLLRSVVIDKVIAGEKDLNLAANRQSSWITSANYEMQPETGQVERNGRKCVVVDIKPRRKSPHLFEGKIWVDAADYTVVRFEGTPSQSPSMFAGDSTIARDYARVDGFSMATHAEAHSHSFLFGDTLLKIDYSDYHIQLDSFPGQNKPKTPAMPTASHP